MARGRTEEATHAFRAGLALERDDLAAQRGLALALAALGRHDEAATYFAEILRREPTDGLANRGTARIAAYQNRRQEAISTFNVPSTASGRRRCPTHASKRAST